MAYAQTFIGCRMFVDYIGSCTIRVVLLFKWTLPKFTLVLLLP